MALVAFGIVALIAVGSGIGLVVRRNPIHGALFLVVNLASVAILYLQMRAEFLALAQVIIYAGAIMVLFVFAIMVLIPGKEETGPDPKRPVRLLAIALAGLLLLEVSLILRSTILSTPGQGRPPGSIEAVGRLLFTDYLLPFEIASVLLLAAIVGVLVLAKRKVS
ncbi:MAG TPA: NADH-quinone oxidoreductase subunit J [Methylomirabilota bacterium]|nr:NADH-quinone oxidoreductase subunit J [Methylomirabilota bacterium]